MPVRLTVGKSESSGIRVYAEKVPINIVMNNIVVNPGLYSKYGDSACIMKLNSMTNVESYYNIVTKSIADLKFVNRAPTATGSPAREKGMSRLTRFPANFLATSGLTARSMIWGR